MLELRKFDMSAVNSLEVEVAILTTRWIIASFNVMSIKTNVTSLVRNERCSRTELPINWHKLKVYTTWLLARKSNDRFAVLA